MVSRDNRTSRFAKQKARVVFGAIRLRYAWVTLQKQAEADREAALLFAELLPAWWHYLIGTVSFATAVFFLNDAPLTKDDVWLILLFGIPSASISRFMILPIFPDPYAWLQKRCDGF